MSSFKNLKEQLEKKRKEAQLNSNSNTENNDQPNKKYKTRGEIEKELKQKKENEKILKEKEKNKNNIDTATVTNNNEINNENDIDTETFLPEKVVIQRLRERGQPITYFGETPKDRASRLKKLEENDPIEYTQGDNEFANILKQIEQQKFKKYSKNNENDNLINNSESDQATIYDKLNNNNKKDKEDENEETEEQLLEESKKSKEGSILYFLKKLLNEWDSLLENRSDEEKKSRQGKIAEATYIQCKGHIQPLFTHLRNKTLPDDILEYLHQITEYCKKREYVKANDEYLQMAIGNAPWPMGVTMVGIHERSSREKIFSNQVAHVLNDEGQRKYIQGVKRLMTFCQQQYPTDPSKCVG
ncbi:hypothetical protein DICPUDRAFT_156019 [Dictyostelium purpureum]|uniref:Pre-mRNA-splicing factor 18 n=1 Tax=Dictyostelium purpureum TaxID=5786 RepID=F0ZVH3_DICPU|nr:uncharacterized protein DICPUDRAFT_156019 [Dictyostelium purpureum]EGC32066.1 hypothetical protein DICPUDRAFT_156019 [Dictyostelium purpureum]|eukprot:XP_003291420.1 hypothetical protein DICPUDRAFT_156019 [Dictyostelium purpureum]